ncbi:Arm DNA-binding domain-containing protein [Alistipes timonensis]
MERKRFCVTFFLRRARTNKAGLAPILARITTNGVSKEVYIQCSVPADKWNQSKEWGYGPGQAVPAGERLPERIPGADIGDKAGTYQ